MRDMVPGNTSPGVLRYPPAKTAFFLRELVFTLFTLEATSLYVDNVRPPQILLDRTDPAGSNRLFLIRFLPGLIDGAFFSRRVGEESSFLKSRRINA
jgi:hypothetical protein